MSKKNPKVIIVGNNPILLEKNYGEFIDSYDIVIRINKCVTEGFEKYVGSKIDIWSTTHNYAKWYGYDFIPKGFENLSYIWKRTPRTQLKSLPTHCSLCNKDINIPTYTMYKTKGYKNREGVKKYCKGLKHEPCTGLLTILTATRFYKNITLYGFSFFDESEGLVRDYYAFDENSISKIELKNYEKEEKKKGKKGKCFFSSDQKEAKLNILKELELNNKIKFLK